MKQIKIAVFLLGIGLAGAFEQKLTVSKIFS